MSELEKFYRGAVVEHRRKDWTPLYICAGMAGLVAVVAIAVAIAITVVVVAVSAVVAVALLKGKK